MAAGILLLLGVIFFLKKNRRLLVSWLYRKQRVEKEYRKYRIII